MKKTVWKRFGDSLLMRLGGVIASISLMALVGMTASWMIAETTQGNGEAINIAGSLRMQSWRMVFFQQAYLNESDAGNRQQLSRAIGEFEKSLSSVPIKSVLASYQQSPIIQSYQLVKMHWEQNIKPLVQNPDPLLPLLLRDKTPNFVMDINTLVKHIEEATEARILVLRVGLATAIIITLLTVLLSVSMIYTSMVRPLRKLLFLTDQMRQGDLSVRTRFTDDDEIGRLGKSFDLMAEDLRRFYQDLESRVAQKTVELTRSNQSLDLLYHSASSLNALPGGWDSFKDVLVQAETLLNLRHSFVCLDKGIATLAADNPLRQPGCPDRSCSQCEAVEAVSHGELSSGEPILRIPLADRGKYYGILAVVLAEDKELDHWQVQLLEAIARHLSVALSAERRSEQQRRVALLEERAVIARELHDSLAQSLAYMRIQVTRLSSAMSAPNSGDQVAEIMEELREGLNSSYLQLRELLSTFRLKMDEESLYLALKDTVEEFTARGDLSIELQIELDAVSLSPNEEIHLLHISREALSNVVRHAKASHAWVKLLNNDTNDTETIIMQIEDDGVGIRQAAGQHHYGMNIMQERSDALRGTIKYKDRTQGGTIVELVFSPSSYHTDHFH